MAKRTRTATGFPLTGGAALLVLGLAGAGSVLGQRNDQVTVDLTECVDLESAEERFACYESQVGAVLDEREPATSSEPADRPGQSTARPARTRAEAAEASGATPSAATPSSAEAPSRPAGANDPQHGAEAAARDRATPSPAREDRSDGNEIFGTIVDMRETIPNSYLITLDNGQVWRQVRPKRYRLMPGLNVRIYPTKWGSSHRLTAVGGNGYIQVERAR